MGCGNAEGAGVLRRKLFTNPFEIANLAQNNVNAAQHMLARFGDALDAFAVACKDVMPSSSSNSMMAFDTPGCDVCSALAVSVRLRLRLTASCTNLNWCRFMVANGVCYAQVVNDRGAPAS